MNEPRDWQSWPELSAPCGLVSFDAVPFGCLRFSSIFARFPLSIAFPGWSHPVLDLDSDGFGTATFTGAFAVQRVALPAGVNRIGDIESFALDQLSGRQGARRPLGHGRSGQPDRRHAQPGHSAIAPIPGAEIVNVVEWDDGEAIFFIPAIDRSLWSFQRRFVDIDDARSAELLASIAWLDSIWFNLLPLVL